MLGEAAGLPEEQSIIGFVRRGLLEVPGVAGVQYRPHAAEEADAATVLIPLLAGETNHGALLFAVKDPAAFRPSLEPLKSFCSMLAVMLSERSQRRRVQDLDQLHFLEGLERVDRSIRQADNLERMLEAVLDSALSLFASDRAWLLYPCDPTAPSWSVLVEKCRPGYPGALSAGIGEIPMLPEARDVFQAALDCDGPVVYGPQSGRPLPPDSASRFSIRSQITMAVYPKTGKPWLFGMHQCSHARVWSDEDVRLFREVARRLADGLSSLLFLKDLQKSGSFLRTLIQTIPDLVWLKDPDGVYLACNRVFERFVGAREADVVGKTDYDFVDRELADFFREHDRKAIAAGKPSSNEEWIIFADDGHRALVDTMKTPMHDAEGRLVGVLGIARDITERRIAEEKILKERDFSRNALESLPGIVYLFDAEGRFLRWNKNFELVSGYSSEEIGRMTPLDFFLEPDRTHIRQRIGVVFEKGSAEAEAEFATKSGKRIPYYFSGKLIQVEDKPCLIGMGIDVSERRKAEDGLRESEERFRHLFHSATDGILIADVETKKFVMGNKTICSMLQYDEGEISGLGVMDIHPQQDLPQVTEQFERQARKEIQIAQGLPVKRRDGSVFYADVSSSPITLGGRTFLLGIFRDMTELRKLEDQLRQSQKMESIGTLAGGVAHDFNNMLMAIIGYGHLALMNMTAGDPNRANVEQMLEASDRAAHLTKDLLLFSRKQAIDRKPVNVNDLIEKLGKFLARVIGEDIAFTSSLDGGTLSILADEHQIGQILMNLATNARDAMPMGGTFTVATGRVLLDREFTENCGLGRPGEYASISVSDTGHGMDEQTRLRIFEPFYTTKGVGKGTGLGLAVVYGIVKQHRGHIEVISEPGRGATFRMYFPVIVSGGGVDDKTTAAAARPVGGTETILLAEDNGALRRMTEAMLKEFGYTVISAVDGEDAVVKFQENKERVQLLLFDLIMPKLSGKEAYEEIRKLRPDIKAVFSTGYSPDVARDKALLEKSASIIFKPLAPADLLRKVREALDAP